MRSALIAVVVSTIIASNSSAQKPDTIAKTKDGTLVITLPQVKRTIPVIDVAAPPPKKVGLVPRRQTTQRFQKDSAARADTMTLRSLAKQKSARPDRAAVLELVIRNDSAFVWLQTGPMNQRLRFVRQKNSWALIPTPLTEGGR